METKLSQSQQEGSNAKLKEFEDLQTKLTSLVYGFLPRKG